MTSASVEGHAVGADRRALALDREECLGLLLTASIGRLVYTDRALPAIIPVNYSIVADVLLVQVHQGSRVARAAAGAVVAFEVDRINEDSRTGWSVVVVGHARQVTHEIDPPQLARPWVTGDRDVRLAIDLDQVTGRQLIRL